MSKGLSITKKIERVAKTVTSIESLRSDLFAKLLPELFADQFAKMVHVEHAIWVVITEDQEYLRNIEKVYLDYADTDPGRHIKFYDAENKELLPVPSDIIALFTSTEGNAKKDLADYAKSTAKVEYSGPELTSIEEEYTGIV